MSDQTWDDELSEIDDEPETSTVQDGPTKKSKPAPATASRNSRAHAERVRRATVKETIAKTLQVAAVQDQQRAVAAAILGCAPQVDVLTEQIMLARKGSTRAVTDLLEVADAADPLEAGIAASILAEDKARLGAAWALAQSLGVLSTSSAPGTGAKAAAQFGRAALALDTGARQALESTMDLIS